MVTALRALPMIRRNNPDEPPASPATQPASPYRFRVHEIMLALKRCFNLPVRMERDLRGSVSGGPVTLRLGFYHNAPAILLRTIPRPSLDHALAPDTPTARSEGYLVYSAGHEHCPHVRALGRLSAEQLAQLLFDTFPAATAPDELHLA